MNKDGLIIHKSRHFVGRRHDYHIFKRSNPKLPPNITRIMDLGYYGIENNYPDLNFILPYKRGKGGTLSDMQKMFNKTLARMKKFKIFSLRYRNRLRYYDMMRDNFRIGEYEDNRDKHLNKKHVVRQGYTGSEVP